MSNNILLLVAISDELDDYFDDPLTDEEKDSQYVVVVETMLGLTCRFGEPGETTIPELKAEIAGCSRNLISTCLATFWY